MDSSEHIDCRVALVMKGALSDCVVSEVSFDSVGRRHGIFGQRCDEPLNAVRDRELVPFTVELMYIVEICNEAVMIGRHIAIVRVDTASSSNRPRYALSIPARTEGVLASVARRRCSPSSFRHLAIMVNT
jgi:hypothetical protein